MRIRLEEQLQQLNLELIKMGVLCEDAINGSIEALFDNSGDGNKQKKIFKKIHDADDEIDHKEREIESLCMKILLRQQPVASDLRIVSSVLKMISDFERIGDQASDIAELAQYLSTTNLTQKIKSKRWRRNPLRWSPTVSMPSSTKIWKSAERYPSTMMS